ncbi:threonine-phosphate decarboxylase CobD [Vibrio salinus]|uniref:threonine-phosphate decarboxylase CobD n=1 Tax=Vibrio salinus TaxID=2899784 RepID=UPI001E34AC30|nr:threonine-phosphate decarboxylase CobD [Vibrio salinus]MCE0495653.1 threonine-phosphate decarboxylase CobD [Vibrio salinus]
MIVKSGQHGGNTRQMAQQFHLDENKLMDFSANINPNGMPPYLKAMIIQHLDKAEHYPDIDYHNLYRSLASHCRQNPENILAGNGATELIYDWVTAISPRKALLVEPSFGEYRRALTQAGCDIRTHSLSEAHQFQVTRDILDVLTDDIDCLFLCTPNNPTGQLIEPSLLADIIDVCEKRHIHLMLDESFMDFVPDVPSSAHSLARSAYLTILRSLTKYFAIPGLRLGYLLSGNTALITKMLTYQKPWTINTFAAIAGEHIFSDPDYQRITTQWLQTQQAYLYEAMNQIPGITVWKPSANYVFFKLNADSVDLQKALLAHHILIRSCENYIGLSRHFYRVAIRSPEDNQHLVSALKLVLN